MSKDEPASEPDAGEEASTPPSKTPAEEPAAASDSQADADGEDEEGLGDIEISPKLAGGIIVGLVVVIVAGFLIYDGMTKSALNGLISEFKTYQGEAASLAAPRPRVAAAPSIEGDARELYQSCMDSLSDDDYVGIADFVNAFDAGKADSVDCMEFSQRMAAPLGMLRQAVRSTQMSPWVDFRRGATAIDTKPYINLSLLLRALINYAFWQRAQGLTVEALELCNLCLQVAHDLCRGGPLAGFESWRAIVDQACYVLMVSGSGSMDSSARAAVIGGLQRVERGVVPFSEMVSGERWLWEFQAASEAGADIEGLPERSVDLFERSVVAENWRVVKEFYGQAEPLTGKPLPESLPALRTLEASIRQTNSTMPQLSAFMASHAVGAVKIKLLRLAQQIYQFEQQKGALPTSLDELGLEAEEVSDPFGTGSLVYLPREEGMRPLLYSVGSDGKDDGGRIVDGDNPLLNDVRGADIVLVVYANAE